MRLHTVITASSVWKFDLTLKRYMRFPRHENPDVVAATPYHGEWEPFVGLERMNDRLMVHRPVPFGTGALRLTGTIEWDDLPEQLEEE